MLYVIDIKDKKIIDITDSEITETNTLKLKKGGRIIKNSIDPISNIVFPKNTIMFENSNSYMKLLYEKDPEVRTFNFNFGIDVNAFKYINDNNFLTDEEKKFFSHQLKTTNRITLPLQLPYVLFVIKISRTKEFFMINETKVFFRTQRTTTNDCYLLIPPMPNIGSNCNYCSGNRNITSPVLTELIEQQVSTFYQLTFNEDYLTNFLDYKGLGTVNRGLKRGLESEISIFSDIFCWYHLTKTNNVEKIFDNNEYITYQNKLLHFINPKIDLWQEVTNFIYLTSNSPSDNDPYYNSYYCNEIIVNGKVITLGDCINITKDDVIYTYEISKIISKKSMSYNHEIILKNIDTDKVITYLSNDPEFGKIIADNYKNSIDSFEFKGVTYKLNDVIKYNSQIYKIINIIDKEGFFYIKVLEFNSSSTSTVSHIVIFLNQDCDLLLFDFEKIIKDDYDIIVDNFYISLNKYYGRYLHFNKDTMLLVFEHATMKLRAILNKNGAIQLFKIDKKYNSYNFNNYMIPVGVILSDPLSISESNNKNVIITKSIDNNTNNILKTLSSINYNGYNVLPQINEFIVFLSNGHLRLAQVIEYKDKEIKLKILNKPVIDENNDFSSEDNSNVSLVMNNYIWTNMSRINKELKDDRFEVRDFLVSTKDDIKNFPNKSVHEVIGLVKLYNKNMLVMSNLNIVDPDWVIANNFIIVKKDIDKMTFDNDNEKKIFLKLRKKKIHIVPKKIVNKHHLVSRWFNGYYGCESFFENQEEFIKKIKIITRQHIPSEIEEFPRLLDKKQMGQIIFVEKTIDSMSYTVKSDSLIMSAYTTMSTDDMLDYMLKTVSIV